MKIEKIILWSNNDEIREIEFSVDKINVLIGHSQAGKSAMISIIDYCLGSSDCNIPINTIRNSCKCFGVVVQLNGKSVLFARQSPEGKKKNSGRMYQSVIRPGAVVPKVINFDRDRTDVVRYINQSLFYTNLALNEKPKFIKDYIPSFRDTIGINFYAQAQLISNSLYFYKHSVPEIKKHFGYIFSYIMEIETKEELSHKRKMEDLDREIKDLSRQRDENSIILNRWEADIDEKLITAKSLGLIDEPIRGDQTFEEKIDILRSVSDERVQLVLREYNITLYDTKEEMDAVEQEIDLLRRELFDLNQQRELIDKQQQLIADVVGDDEARFSYKISDWLTSDTNFFINVDKDNNAYGYVIYTKILENIKNEERELAFYTGFAENLDRQYVELNRRYKTINQTYMEKVKIKSRLDARASSSDIRDDILMFKGELKSYLAVYTLSLRNDDLDETINQLKDEWEAYKNKVEDAINGTRKQRFIDMINGTLRTFVDLFNVEYKGENVRFDMKRVELEFQDLNGNVYVGMDKIGSGSNFVEYHIIMAFLLLTYLLNEVKVNRTLKFVVFDQPSQAYFPSEIEIKDVQDTEQATGDVTNLKKLYRAISNIKRDYCQDLQIIIFDHAGEEYWKDTEGGYYNNLVHIIDWKKTDEKLIPEHWIDVA